MVYETLGKGAYTFGNPVYIEDDYLIGKKALKSVPKVLASVETDEQFIKAWESVECQGKGFDEMTPKIYTAKGERVRSKSEVIIADILNQEGIPYRYECPLQLKGWGKYKIKEL